MMPRIAFLGLCMLALVGLSACGPELVYEKDHPLPGIWTYADSIEFSYEIQDIEKAYDLYLEVAHTDVFPTQNLYTRFVTSYPNGLRQTDEVSLELADKFGQWLGNCSGETCQLRIPLQQDTKYPEAGDYGLTIHQYGRQDSLQALMGLSLKIYVSSE